jgi:hypothetical protein
MIADNEWNLRCPDCGGTGAIDIAATVWVRLCPDGTDVTLSHNGDHDWNQDSPVCCATCWNVGSRSIKLAPPPLELQPLSPT